MKQSLMRINPEFTPIELTIVIESQAELDVLYQLGNYHDYVAECLKSRTYLDKHFASSVFEQFYHTFDGVS